MKRLRYIWIYLFLGGCLYFPWIWLGDHRELASNHVLRNGPALAVALVCQWGCWWLACWTWRRLLSRHTEVRLSLWESAIQMMSVLLGKYLPGKIWGMLARGARMAEMGIAKTDVLALSVLDQYYSVCCGGIVAVCLLLLWLGGPVWLLLLPVLVVGAGGVERMRQLAWSWVRRWPKYQHLAELRVDWVESLQLQAGFAGVWILQSAAISLLHRAFFPSTLSAMDFIWLMASNIVGILVGFLALFAPGGIGVREVVATSMSATIMPWDEALALQLIARVWLVLHEVLVGGAIVALGVKIQRKS